MHDAHDRYANLEVSYLLQRMEEYDGIVVLASNLRNNIDEAFIRRLHFAVDFPFPDAGARQEILRRILPKTHARGQRRGPAEAWRAATASPAATSATSSSARPSWLLPMTHP